MNLRTSSAATAVSGSSICRVAHAKGMTPAANQAVRREHTPFFLEDAEEEEEEEDEEAEEEEGVSYRMLDASKEE